MNFLITQGLGSAGDGGTNGTMTVMGLGASGAPLEPVCLALQVLDVTNFGGYLIVTFSNQLVVSGPGLDPTKYLISGDTDIVAEAISVLAPGHLLRIDTDDQKQGGSYVLTLPIPGIMDVNSNPINGPFVWHFTGIGTPVEVQIVKSIDERALDIVFNKPVLAADALNPANYSVNGGLQVLAAVRVTDFNYRLTTTPQTIDQLYTISISNIRDIHGN